MRNEALLIRLKEEEEKWRPEKFEQLSQREKNIHAKAFTTNVNDPDYHELTTLQYHDGNTERTMQVPKGDVLHQFREDVKNGALPTVSWIVAPENFSDHPGAPWYGAWYLAEVMDILTQNPEDGRKRSSYWHMMKMMATLITYPLSYPHMVGYWSYVSRYRYQCGVCDA